MRPVFHLRYAACLMLTSLTAASAACPGQTQSEMNQCAGAKFQATEQKLNVIYGKLEKTAGLIKSQNAWVTYRDAQCAYEAEDFEGGSMQPMIIGECRAAMNHDRAKLLERIANSR